MPPHPQPSPYRRCPTSRLDPLPLLSLLVIIPYLSSSHLVLYVCTYPYVYLPVSSFLHSGPLLPFPCPPSLVPVYIGLRLRLFFLSIPCPLHLSLFSSPQRVPSPSVLIPLALPCSGRPAGRTDGRMAHSPPPLPSTSSPPLRFTSFKIHLDVPPLCLFLS